LRYEVTPFVGFRMGGSFTLSDTGQRVAVDDHASLGLALDVRTDDATQYELFYGRQSTVMRGDSSLLAPTHIDVEYLHLGGTVSLDEELRVKTYLVGGLGVTRFSPDFAPGHASTRFSASLGAGLRVPWSEHFSLRLEARGFVTLVNPDTAFFCRSDETGLLCRVHSHGSTFIQYDLLAGVAYAF
jgi:opacity protein-like surface antigen